MAITNAEPICNKALAKLGGGENTRTITDIDATSGTAGKTSKACKLLYTPTYKEVLKRMKPQECLYYADLGADLKDTEIDITSITVAADPFPVTVTTSSVHGKSTGDQLFLMDVEGTGGILSLNGGYYTITVVDTTSFTLDDIAGTLAWSHTADTGVMSDAPESAEWLYVFALPTNCLQVVAQIDEQYHKLDYDHEIKQGYFFTNALSNDRNDSAYIEYIKNEEDGSVYSTEVVEAIATKLAAELAPRTMLGEGSWARREKLLEEYERIVLPTSMGINRSQQHQDEKPRESKYEVLGDRYEYD